MSIKVSVTGAKGFVGKTLLQQILQHTQIQLVGQPAFQSKFTTVEEILESYVPCDVIIHLASKTFVPHSFSNPYDFYTNNINSTVSVLELCRLKNIKLIFLSSYIYGEPNYTPIDELHPTSSHNPYAHSKIVCETLCENYAKFFDVKYTILRPFNIYGFNQPEHFLIAKILKMLDSGSVTLDDPRPKRDYINVIDLADVIIKVIEVDEFSNQTLNVCSGQSISIQQITDTLLNAADTKFTVNYSNIYRPNEILDTIGDNTKICKMLNWMPKHNLLTDLPNLLNAYYGKN
jgi:nucleoside-diphosphate-sugar epimerase